jgi:hypothetical protein
MRSLSRMTRTEYLAFRREFEPTTVILVIVVESPPISGKYFYNPAGRKASLSTAGLNAIRVSPIEACACSARYGSSTTGKLSSDSAKL